jgi:hypothetical protein
MRKILLLQIILLFLTTMPSTAAEENVAEITRMIQLSRTELNGACTRQVIMKDAVGGELFTVETCPFCRPGAAEVTERKKAGQVSKGILFYPFECRLQVTDYYVGQKKKQFERKEAGHVTADYLYVFGELNFLNLAVEGNPACARPLIDHLQSLGKTKD